MESADRVKVEIIRGVLEEHGINAIIIDKQDSAYTFFGELELYVNRDDILRAMTILKQNEI